MAQENPPAGMVSQCGCFVSLRGSGQGVNGADFKPMPHFEFKTLIRNRGKGYSVRTKWRLRVDRYYPLTLTRENESTALPEVGRPMDVAGRKVVKISMFFTCEGSSLAASGFDNTR